MGPAGRSPSLSVASVRGAECPEGEGWEGEVGDVDDLNEGPALLVAVLPSSLAGAGWGSDEASFDVSALASSAFSSAFSWFEEDPGDGPGYPVHRLWPKSSRR